MPPRGRRARQAVAGTPEATGGRGDMSEGESSHPQAESMLRNNCSLELLRD